MNEQNNYQQPVEQNYQQPAPQYQQPAPQYQQPYGQQQLFTAQVPKRIAVPAAIRTAVLRTGKTAQYTQRSS